MFNIYFLNDEPKVILSDLAGEFPLYIYLSNDNDFVIYSDSVKEIFEHELVKKPFTVNEKGISFLLQSDVIPPPLTAYKELFILGIGDSVTIYTDTSGIKMDFKHEFPFFNKNRNEDKTFNKDCLLKMLCEATESRLDENKEIFLFHSAGKDSNSIAIALSCYGNDEIKNSLTLVTQRSKGDSDESQISKRIANSLGFKHIILDEIDILEEKHIFEIDNYFKNSSFPCTDNICLAYPLYSYQLPQLKDSNIIFGDGNDSHMASPPTSRQIKFSKLAYLFSKASIFRNLIKSESVFHPFLRTSAEWFGPSGFTYHDVMKFYPNATSVYTYWSLESNLRKKWDVVDFKTDIYSTRIISEKMIRKLFNFGESIHSNVILPFSNNEVALYLSKLPECYVFNRKTMANKPILREILSEYLNIDSDKIGKMGWSFDIENLVRNNWDYFLSEISACVLWEMRGLYPVLERLKNSINSQGKYSNFSAQLFYRIFLISCWHSKCELLNEK